MTTQTNVINGGIVLVRLAGDLDMYNATTIKELAQRLWNDGHRKFIIDLDELAYIDSSGIGVLLYVYSSARKRNAHVLYVNVRGPVLKVIELTKLVGFLPMADDIETARRLLDEIVDGEEPASQRHGLIVDEFHRLQDTSRMEHKTFHIDFSQIRRLSNLLAQQAPPEIQEINMLEQQISEIIKNAVKHGNRNDPSKAVRIWYSFSATHAHLVVEDDGDGFAELERWNEFYAKKLECYENQDFEEMMNYLAFRTERSDETDGGNAMFAAVEYWNDGVVYNEKRNRVAVRRAFT